MVTKEGRRITMQEQESATRQCPYCKEEIKAEAVRCKYCQATFPPEKPTHGGVCPYCKENINPEAIRCLHCKSDLTPAGAYSGWQEPLPKRLVTPRQTAYPPPIIARPRVQQPSRVRVQQPGSLFSEQIRQAPPGCNDYEIDENGHIYCFVVAVDDTCYYEMC